MASNFRTLLVIGDKHQEIAAKYSLDTKVDKYLRYKFDDANALHVQFLKDLENKIQAWEKTDKENPLYQYYMDMYEESKKQDDFDFYQEFTIGCWYDEEGNAWSTENQDAHYQYEKCYDKRIRQDQRNEATFSNPFILKDGTKAYSALKGEIDWDKIHMVGTELYERTWEMCVEGDAPKNDTDELIYNNMSNRHDYFDNFKNKEEFVTHSCAFWTYGVATEDMYYCGEQSTALQWTTNFFKDYIEPLSDDTRLSIYEIKLL